MQLSAVELATLNLANQNPEGLLVAFDPNDGPLTMIPSPGVGKVEIGESGLRRLLTMGHLRPSGGDSYQLTDRGRKVVNDHKSQIAL